jgi:uncharacterized protein (DUF302 family)
MLHVIESKKSVGRAAADLEEAVKRHDFGVLHVYDLKAKLNEKGVEFAQECRILEVCNPKQAAKVLDANMSISLALPCRISVYDEQGKTKIGTILPTALLSLFPGSGELGGVAEEVEKAILQMMEEAK